MTHAEHSVVEGKEAGDKDFIAYTSLFVTLGSEHFSQSVESYDEIF